MFEMVIADISELWSRTVVSGTVYNIARQMNPHENDADEVLQCRFLFPPNLAISEPNPRHPRQTYRRPLQKLRQEISHSTLR